MQPVSDLLAHFGARVIKIEEHSEDILSVLGYTAAQMEQIRSEGVIGKKADQVSYYVNRRR